MIVDDTSGPHWQRVLRKAFVIASLRLRNRGRARVTGDVPLVVSLTSYGPRFADAELAIEAIAAGKERPARLVLWVAEGDLDLAARPRLERLRRRGLEIRQTKDYRSFKKLYPYAVEEGRTLAMVTADDDILYPRDWLSRLYAAHREQPTHMVGLRAHRVELDGAGSLAPYATWPAQRSGRASHATFFTSGHGIVVPVAVLDAVREAGEGFMDSCLHADDVWLFVQGVRAGVRNAWIVNDIHALGVPGSQAVALHHENVSGGRNDVYLDRHVVGDVYERVAADAEAAS